MLAKTLTVIGIVAVIFILVKNPGIVADAGKTVHDAINAIGI